MIISIDTDGQYLEIDGVKISLAFLCNLAKPDPRVLYRLERDGNDVTVFTVVDGVNVG